MNDEEWELNECGNKLMSMVVCVQCEIFCELLLPLIVMWEK